MCPGKVKKSPKILKLGCAQYRSNQSSRKIPCPSHSVVLKARILSVLEFHKVCDSKQQTVTLVALVPQTLGVASRKHDASRGLISTCPPEKLPSESLPLCYQEAQPGLLTPRGERLWKVRGHLKCYRPIQAPSGGKLRL